MPGGGSYRDPGNPAKEKKEIHKAEAGYQYCRLLIDVKNKQNKYNISSGDIKMVTGTESHSGISFGLINEGENGYTFKVFPVGATFFCDPDKSNTYCFVFLISKNKDIKEYEILFKDVKISY